MGLALLLASGVCVHATANAPDVPVPSPMTAIGHLPLPDGPEKQLVKQHCMACHDIARIENAGGTRSGWKSRLERMIRRGSTLPRQDVPALATYLARALPERLRAAPPPPTPAAR